MTLRSLFPQLSEQVYGKPLVYLDNAATALRPQSVIDCWKELSERKNANLHRAVHYTAEVATAAFEDARDAVRAFIGAASREEVIFTSGATHSLNLAAFSFSEAFVKEGDEVLVDENSHHSNIVPWQLMCQRKGAVLKHFDPQEDIAPLLSEKTRIVAVTHISNVLGVVNPVGRIVAAAHAKGIPVLVDGAQGIVHSKVDVTALDCDFYAFSGHKMYAAPGTGVLYCKRSLLEQLPPYMSGGEMVGTVSWNGTTFAPLPHRFEAGTQNMAGIPTFVPAIEVMREMEAPEVRAEQKAIVDYLLEALPAIPGLTLYGQGERIPLFSISIKGAHHEDLALILDKMGVAVRSGQMCAEPLMDKMGVSGMLRASFAPYNTLAEAEYFISSLRKAVTMLTK